MTWKPLAFFAVALAGWMSRQQQDVIEFLREENRILREKLGHKRLILNESQKRRLATAAMKLGKDLLRQFGTQFSPDTLIRWHRWLVAVKYDSSDRRGKRGPAPTKANMIRKLVIQMARCSPYLATPPRRLGKAQSNMKSTLCRLAQAGNPRLRLLHPRTPPLDSPGNSVWPGPSPKGCRPTTHSRSRPCPFNPRP